MAKKVIQMRDKYKSTTRLYPKITMGSLSPDVKEYIESQGGGTEVVANPTLAGTEADLTGLQVGDTKYAVPQGTQVVANPPLAGTEAVLTSIQVGNIKYAVSGYSIHYSAQDYVLQQEDYFLSQLQPSIPVNTNDVVIFKNGYMCRIYNVSSPKYYVTNPVQMEISSTVQLYKHNITIGGNVDITSQSIRVEIINNDNTPINTKVLLWNWLNANGFSETQSHIQSKTYKDSYYRASGRWSSAYVQYIIAQSDSETNTIYYVTTSQGTISFDTNTITDTVTEL